MKFFQIFLIIAEIELVARSPSTLRPTDLEKKKEALRVCVSLRTSAKVLDLACWTYLSKKNHRQLDRSRMFCVSNSYLDCEDQPCAKKSLDESLGGKKPKEHIPFKFFYFLTDQIFLFSKTIRLNILHIKDIFTKSNWNQQTSRKLKKERERTVWKTYSESGH